MLLKTLRDGAFVFESENYSRKGTEIAENPSVAMTLYWREVHRQVCIEGAAAPLSLEISDEMWAERGRPNQAASIATREGAELDSLEHERALHAAADALVASGRPLERPASYLAYAITPCVIEFWEGSADRLHRRLLYERRKDAWTWRRIQP